MIFSFNASVKVFRLQAMAIPLPWRVPLGVLRGQIGPAGAMRRVQQRPRVVVGVHPRGAVINWSQLMSAQLG